MVPSRAVLAWAEAAAGDRARVARTTPFSQSGDGGPWRVDLETSSGPVSAVLKSARDSAAARRSFATEAAAMTAAASHGIPAAQVLGLELSGAVEGRVLVLTTLLAGSTTIPERPDPARLRGLGAAAARIHAVDVAVSATLPPRGQPLQGADLGDGGHDALVAAQRLLADPPPSETSGLVHGDLWHGNTLWAGDEYQGAIDWDYAGVGPAGIDLGSLRCDAALMYGGEAPDLVLAGWEEAHSGPASNLAYWDVVAAARTPPELRHWVPNFHAQGRTDLTVELCARRRDEFLAGALDRLG